jgi:alkylation response protein AidB-like acyl-CoA dehydrogenase
MDLAGTSGVAWSSEDQWTDRTAWSFLRSRASTIGGGTTEMMRNIVGERVLGLPKEPDPYRDQSWRDTPR